ncbi:MAG: tetratricopeptide repeat protein [Bacteroidales bacterium]
MRNQEVLKKYDNACKLIHKRRVADAIEVLRQLIKVSGKEFLHEELNELQDTYSHLLQHSFAKVQDPEREKIYTYLLRTLLEMSDKLREMLLTENGEGHIVQLKKAQRGQNAAERMEALETLESLAFDDELSGLLKDAKVSDSGISSEREKTLGKLFASIWLTDKFAEDENNLLGAVCDSEKLLWHDKALIVSALTLSLLRYFDVHKFELLFRFVEKQEDLVWERAMIGLFIGFLKYNDRYHLYTVLEEKTLALQFLPNIEQHIEAILIQFIKSRETERVKKKWEEEILPEMMKMRPRIEEKLDLNNIFSDTWEEDEKNPDWETVFEDAPDLLNKLQELTEMQMDGMDVFISAFAQLKHFPFFRETSNWFLPFYAQNPAVQSAVHDPDKGIDLTPILEKLENTYFMCNSDKYSFSFNLEMVPDQQKSMMMNMLNAEMENISELEKDQELQGGLARSKSIYTQYFQDLYRFYKLHPWRNEFDDIFSLDLDLHETWFVQKLVSDNKTIRNIAEFLFDKQFYEDALKVFLSILDKDKSSIELFEKIAFCYEKQADFSQAFRFYQKADLIEGGRLWIIKKLAYCCKYLNRWEEALSYYQQAEIIDPEDLRVQANIGQCLIHLERYQEALEYYFKVEVLAPENHKIRRPLAWCSFLLGKFDTAKDYLERLLANEPDNPYDLMNLGHVNWCRREPVEAFQMYLKSIRTWKSLKEFEKAFNEDRIHLAKHGIQEMDMNLMLDYLKLEIRNKQGSSG